MLSYLLEQWSKIPGPWFSKRRLEEISKENFKTLVAKKILLYELPSGEESVDEERCSHGCSLFVEERGSGYEAFCLDHPEEKVVRVTEDDLCRYRLSIENVIKQMRSANKFEGEPFPCGRGHFIGYKTHGDKTIGVVLVPCVTKGDLLGIAGMASILKDYHYIFVVSPELNVKWLWAVPMLGDRIVLLKMDELFDEKTFELSFDWGIFKLRQRGVLKDFHLDVTGRQDRDGHEVRLNGDDRRHLSDAPFILLLRFVQGYLTAKDRWVSVQELIKDGVLTEDNLYQAINNLKKDMDWKELIENQSKKYRIALSVTGLTVNKQKLLESDNARIKGIAKKLP